MSGERNPIYETLKTDRSAGFLVFHDSEADCNRYYFFPILMKYGHIISYQRVKKDFPTYTLLGGGVVEELD